MAIALNDYLFTPVAGVITPWINVWVRLVSNNTSTAYVSDAATDSKGRFTFATKPPGDTYTVYTGPTNVGAWTSTGDVAYAVPVVQGENPSFQSETTQASGPYTSKAIAGEQVTAVNPYNLKAYGALGNGVADDTAAIVAALAAAPTGATVYAPPGTYNHTAITWNKRVNLVGDSSQGSTFVYTPTTGTAWTVNPANNVNQPDTFRFAYVGMNGPNPTGSATALSIACDYFDYEYGSIQNFGTGLTFGNNAFFLNFVCVNWQFCNQIMLFPGGLSGSGENLRFLGCTFINAQSANYINGVQLSGNGDFFFQSPSFDQCQLKIDGQGANVRISSGHFEVVTANNPAASYISQTAGTLTILGGVLLVPSSNAALPQAISLTDTGDAGNTSAYIYGLHAYSNGIAVPCVVISGGIHAWVVMDTQGGWSNDINNTTTGSFLVASKTRSVIRTSGIVASVSNQLDTTMVSGWDVSFSNAATFSVSAARVIGAPVNPSKGQRITFMPIQGGVGGFALTWNAIFKGITWSDAGNVTGARSSISFIYDGTNWNQDGAQSPYHA